ncbi:restriction endonuclease [Ignicoccus hospitalis]|uniref:Endonuclease (RecB family)-like protein n=1 Tax=Ignicoccus hospitalis (strain KIN4/I / DSM 18386 / JCM 14125) TaxID=453591 RepID=A8A9R2_IGNH4|nr:restriction endonuclease [Ignicoccus hospitalis]ABU81664.1 endonuclease (RecB family)-like protein [Ignicoccus hospitalis KIN4/I]HIH89781.1 hypothetical protein [Desulfurococcaceae archaeon]
MRRARSERLAEEVLRSMGFEVVSVNAPVKVGDKEVAEVDLLVKPPPGPLAVEVKSGKVDVSAVRQAYANAKAIGAEPMVMGSGWANEEAKLLADKLGVKYLMFEDVMVASKEELYDVVKGAVTEVLVRFINSLYPDERACVIAEAGSLEEAEKALGKEELRKLLKRMGRAGGSEAVLAAARLSCLLWKLLKGVKG